MIPSDCHCERNEAISFVFLISLKLPRPDKSGLAMAELSGATKTKQTIGEPSGQELPSQPLVLLAIIKDKGLGIFVSGPGFPGRGEELGSNQ